MRIMRASPNGETSVEVKQLLETNDVKQVRK